MPFIKMQGIGNDYVYIDEKVCSVSDPSALSIQLSNRHTGIGSDGLILIGPSESADARMQMWNADGSQAQMCGNGIRCVAKYLADSGQVSTNTFTIETLGGVKNIEVHRQGGDVKQVSVDMGLPGLDRADIPMVGPPGRVIEEELEQSGERWQITAVSMGNPHIVVFVDDPRSYPVESVGPILESHPSFPQRTNVHFAQIIHSQEIRMRAWERGSGETQACGTGACAVLVAGALTQRTERQAKIHLPGGELQIEWLPSGRIRMTGPAVEVFRGTFRPR
ncbi:MAG: diaminopimelate epimerase [Planctomycetota bacterium]|nr:diaminopimelate epimerase [Planctomycetota bacterium]